jgi:hypothetical protein
MLDTVWPLLKVAGLLLGGNGRALRERVLVSNDAGAETEKWRGTRGWRGFFPH